MRRNAQRGISLIEIAIGLAILGIGIAWAIPSYSVWTQNLQIRNMAESIVAGLKIARSEALARNSRAEFILTDQAPSNGIAQDALGTLVTAAGPNWMVRAFNPPGGATYTYVTGSSGAEGSRNATMKSGNDNFAGGLAAVTFDRYGRLARDPNGAIVNVDASLPMTKICVRSASLTAANGARILEINISAGGQVKMCDPSVAAASDPRRCVTALPRCAQGT